MGEHISAAEKKLGHQMRASFAQPAGPPMGYPVPDFGQDHDIKESLVHTKAAEDKYGEWRGATFAPAPEPPRNYFLTSEWTTTLRTVSITLMPPRRVLVQ